MHINIRGIKHNLQILNNFLQSNSLEPDIIMTSESWSSDDNINLYIPDNYNLMSSYCRKNCIRGGVSIFSKPNYKLKQFQISSCIEKYFEACCSYMKIGKKYIVFLALYRSPSTPSKSFHEYLDNCLTTLYSKFGHNSTYFIGGDLNINFLSESVELKLLFDVFESYGFKLNYKDPTRIHGTCMSGIDYLLSNIPCNQYSCSVVQSNISDHFHQTLNVPKSYIGLTKAQDNKGKISKRFFSNNNINKFKSYLINCNTDFDFYQNFIKLFNICFPLKSVKIINNANHSVYTSSYLKEFSTSLREWHSFFKDNHLPISQDYRDMVKVFKKDVIQNRITVNNNKISNSKNKIKTTWDVINQKIKNKNTSQNVKLIHNGTVLQDYECIVNCFLDTFLPINVSVNNSSYNISINSYTQQQMFLFPTDPFEIKNIILNLPNTTSVGPDNIPTSLIKSCVDIICLPLCNMINQIFESGCFPEHFKLAKIIPLFKKGSKLDPSNYRPLVIQNVFSKVIEKVFTIRLINYLVKFKLINSCQYAYLKGKSVELAIYNFLSAIYDSLENSLGCIGIFYDFSKAFDMVEHDILFQKLLDLGVNNKSLQFIQSYLSNRRYFVQLSETDAEGNIIVHKSAERVWNKGVPQGSNLGPYLFLIMINDLPSHLSCKLLSMFTENISLISSLYADDVNSILSHKNIKILEEICNASINLLHLWCTNNGLKLNINKTNFIQFKSAHNRFVAPKPSLQLENSLLSSASTCVFLGLRINENLNWDDHVDHLCGKLRSGCFALGRLREEISFETLKTVYYAHIYSHLKNNIIFWGYSTCASRIFILQKRSLRIIYDVSTRHSCVDLFQQFGILTVPSIYIYECILFVKKNPNLFSKNCDTHGHYTRQADKLRVLQHSKALFGKCPKYRLVHIYNKLPDHIKCIDKIKLFKKALFKYLFDLNLYCVQDYLNN
jgi:hypothetical protein